MSLLFRTEGNPFRKVCKGKTLTREPKLKGQRQNCKQKKKDDRNWSYSQKKENLPFVDKFSSSSAYLTSRKELNVNGSLRLNKQNWKEERFQQSSSEQTHIFNYLTQGNNANASCHCTMHSVIHARQSPDRATGDQLKIRGTSTKRNEWVPISYSESYIRSNLASVYAPDSSSKEDSEMLKHTKRHFVNLWQESPSTEKLPLIRTEKRCLENGRHRHMNHSPCSRTPKPICLRNGKNKSSHLLKKTRMPANGRKSALHTNERDFSPWSNKSEQAGTSCCTAEQIAEDVELLKTCSARRFSENYCDGKNAMQVSHEEMCIYLPHHS